MGTQKPHFGIITALIASLAVQSIGCGKKTDSSRFQGGGAGQFTSDMNRLEELEFPEASVELKKVVDGSGSVEALTRWVDARVNYIIPAVSQSVNILSVSDSTVRTLASNLGAKYFSESLQTRETYSIHLDRDIEITTPRVGVLMVGEGLSDPALLPQPSNADALSNSLFRLKTLFHEARHSDGNGENAGMKHVVCPSGHDYEGSYSCDTMANGAYEVGTQVMRHFVKACGSQCNSTDIQILNLIVSDNSERILSAELVDADPVAAYHSGLSEIFKEFLHTDLITK